MIISKAGAIREEHEGTERWIEEIKDNFNKMFDYLPEDGSNYEGTGYWRYACLRHNACRYIT